MQTCEAGTCDRCRGPRQDIAAVRTPELWGCAPSRGPLTQPSGNLRGSKTLRGRPHCDCPTSHLGVGHPVLLLPAQELFPRRTSTTLSAVRGEGRLRCNGSHSSLGWDAPRSGALLAHRTEEPCSLSQQPSPFELGCRCHHPNAQGLTMDFPAPPGRTEQPSSFRRRV